MTGFVRGRFGGDYAAAFRHYDTDGDGLIDRAGLKVLLTDAGVGNALTRWAWVSGILAVVDRDRDGEVSWDEFSAVAEVGR
ncbi:MAG TPA: EF-hand domain-containing protein [Gemmataceae bacterium]|nr:EF-hand domain-containing protein [Gemmataceae bacterium]